MGVRADERITVLGIWVAFSGSGGGAPMLSRVPSVHAEATTQNPFETDADTVVIGVFEDEGVAHDLPGGELMALLDNGEAQRKFKRLAVTHAQGRRVILAGLGDRTKFDGERARAAAGVVQARAAELSTKTLCWEVPHHVGDDVVAGLVEGTALRAYRFDRYKKAEDPDPFERLVLSAHHDVAGSVRTAEIVVRAQNRARDLGNIPANDLPPAALAGYAAELAARSGSRRRSSTRTRSASSGWERSPRSPRARLRARG